MSPPHPALHQELIRRFRRELRGDSDAGAPSPRPPSPTLRRLPKRALHRLLAPAISAALRYANEDIQGISAGLREQERQLRAVQAELELLKGRLQAMSSDGPARPQSQP